MNHEMDLRASRELGRLVTGGYKDSQQGRMSMMNRFRDVIYHINEGIPFNVVQEKKKKKTYAKKYQDKNLPALIEQMTEEGRLTETQAQYCKDIFELARNASALEREYQKFFSKFVHPEEIWERYLKHIPGIAETISATLIAKLRNCENFEHVSSLWRYFGLHPICPVCEDIKEEKDAEGKMEKVHYPVVVGSDGKCLRCGRKGIAARRIKGRKVDYNPNLKTFGWLIADCLMKKRSPIYRDVYDNEKARLSQVRFQPRELMQRYGDKYYKKKAVKYNQGHLHRMAMRKVQKMFLQHYWVVTRTLAGLPVSKPYIQDRMGHQDIITWMDVMRANGVDPATVTASA